MNLSKKERQWMTRLPKVAIVHKAELQVLDNDPCPCNSGKKYKKCHKRLEYGMDL